MFHSARIKLTGWYLLIIMLVSVSFSMVVYRVLTIEVERFSHIQRLRIERRLRQGELYPPGVIFRNMPMVPIMDPELVEETNHRIALALVAVNGSVLLLSGALGYLLAGRTLKPIGEMLDEQNQFITDSSHEFRTPLTSLKSALEVNLRDKHLSLTDAKNLISESIIEVNKLQILSDNLLHLAQFQKPNGIPMEKIILSDVVGNAVKKVGPLAKRKSIPIENDTQSLILVGNAENLCDLLVILLDNAIKYSPVGKPIAIRSKKTDGSVDMSVGDSGIGIDKKDIHRVFDRFYRADSARSKDSTGGYGLGLSIAKKIVKMHHGSISVESAPGKGSTFTVRLPLKQTGYPNQS